MSHHYPSMCQTVCEGAAAHRRPANWFDTGEKWCMIVLVNPSLSGCQMVWAWGHCDHIRPWFLHSAGFHPGVCIAVPAAFRLPYFNFLFALELMGTFFFKKKQWRNPIPTCGCNETISDSKIKSQEMWWHSYGGEGGGNMTFVDISQGRGSTGLTLHEVFAQGLLQKWYPDQEGPRE